MNDVVPPMVLVYVTCADPVEADTIGRALVGERLAACVNLIPGMRSLYWWQGAIERGEETVLIAKTTAALAPVVAARVKDLHRYTCPCVLTIPILGGDPAYLAWLAKETRAADGS